MMNNDSVAISPQEAPSDSSRLFYKGNPGVDKLPLTSDRTRSRLGVAGEGGITCLRQDSSSHQKLLHLSQVKLYKMKKKKSQQKMVDGEDVKKEEEAEEDQAKR
ncbi:hypothetical protein PBY51_008915 [Eleginops maclovinus]|uniref:Uncharacterized protein n=1 Tax=Eleginops maclovinus TaxID=56733 RepID=A0AAN7WV20_ELEMC|nr:hypothetical protein PBY51_008915 [Eleginops maclovinus]